MSDLARNQALVREFWDAPQDQKIVSRSVDRLAGR